MLSCLVSRYIYNRVECHYSECRYAECHYTECLYAECHGAPFSINTINLISTKTKLFLKKKLKKWHFSIRQDGSLRLGISGRVPPSLRRRRWVGIGPGPPETRVRRRPVFFRRRRRKPVLLHRGVEERLLRRRLERPGRAAPERVAWKSGRRRPAAHQRRRDHAEARQGGTPGQKWRGRDS